MIEIRKIDNPGEECISIRHWNEKNPDLGIRPVYFSTGTILSITTRQDGSVLISDVEDENDFIVVRH